MLYEVEIKVLVKAPARIADSVRNFVQKTLTERFVGTQFDVGSDEYTFSHIGAGSVTEMFDERILGKKKKEETSV